MQKKLLILFFVFTLPLFSQKQAANWYFGNRAGLNFNTAIATAQTDGQLNQMEGCASISDENGNLLFYTNGIVVYNANHAIMQNGTGLLGSDSSSQSAIIIPDPGNNLRYYIFTVDLEGMSNGIRYTAVDMSLDLNLGGVIPTQKNIPIESRSTEKITAVYHQNQHDIWVVAHRTLNNEYIAYLVSDAGVQSTPVVSQVGSIHGAADGTIGYLKCSPDGKHIAAAKYAYIPGVELFDFDTASGIISNLRQVNNVSSYGVEFSPDSKLLYANQGFAGSIYQYDITSGDQATIQASASLITTASYSSLQLGLDGKIYAAQPNATRLGVINNPNALGNSCNFHANGISLQGRISLFGLPAFIQNSFIQEIEVEGFCPGTATRFHIKSSVTATAAYWNFGDGTTSGATSPQHIFALPGTYTVSVDFTSAAGPDVIHLEEEVTIVANPIAHPVGDMHRCDTLPNDGLASFVLQEQNLDILGSQTGPNFTVGYYLIEADAIADDNEILGTSFDNTSNPQTIFVRVSNILTGCYDISSFDLIVDLIPGIGTPSPLKECETIYNGATAKFDLTQATTQIANGNLNLVVTFFESPSNLQNNVPIADPVHYTSSSQTIYFSAFDPLVTCVANGVLVLIVNSLPAVNTNIRDYQLCDYSNPGDGFETFDLTTMQASLSNQNGLTFSYSYDNAGTPVTITVPTAFENTITGQQTIFVSVANGFGCISHTSFNLKVNALPQINQNLPPFITCEFSSGQGSFDLLAITQALVNESGLTVNYYATRFQAEIGGNDTLLSPFRSPDTIIFGRVQTSDGCFITQAIDLQVVTAPAFAQPTPLEICDDDKDGRACFNLDAAALEATAGNTSLVLTFHESAADAQNNVNAINGSSYCNIEPDTQILSIRIGYNTTTALNCASFTQLQLTVNPVPAAFESAKLQGCDANNDGIELFNLTLATPEILDDLDPVLYDVAFYPNVQDAIDNVNEIAGTLNYGSTTATLGVRVTDIATGCLTVVPLELAINTIPDRVDYTVSGAFQDNQILTIFVNGVGVQGVQYAVDNDPWQQSNVFANLSMGTHILKVKTPCKEFELNITLINYPHYFTPNGDGYNDTWNVVGLNDATASINIFDRYGKLLKQISTTGQGWNGTYNGRHLPSSDYWFTISFNEDGKQREFKAHFTLKR